MSEAGSHGGFGSLRTDIAALAGLALIALYFWHAVIRAGRQSPGSVETSLLTDSRNFSSG
jgi:hypothetical protein